MRASIYFVVACAVALLGQTAPTSAKGCIKGALVGGIAGHAGHHGLAGGQSKR